MQLQGIAASTNLCGEQQRSQRIGSAACHVAKLLDGKPLQCFLFQGEFFVHVVLLRLVRVRSKRGAISQLREFRWLQNKRQARKPIRAQVAHDWDNVCSGNAQSAPDGSGWVAFDALTDCRMTGQCGSGPISRRPNETGRDIAHKRRFVAGDADRVASPIRRAGDHPPRLLSTRRG